MSQKETSPEYPPWTCGHHQARPPRNEILEPVQKQQLPRTLQAVGQGEEREPGGPGLCRELAGWAFGQLPGGAFGILSYPLPPPPRQKRGRRGGMGEWGHAELQEPVCKKSWNTGSLTLSLGPALLGSGEESHEGNTEVRIRPKPG